MLHKSRSGLNFKKPRRDVSEVSFLTLAEYTRLAKDTLARVLAKRKRGLLIRITSNEDYLSEVIQALVNADWTFDDTKSSLQTWRIKYVKWAIMSISANLKATYEKNNEKSLVDDDQQEIPSTYEDRHMGRVGHKMYKTPHESDKPDLDSLLKNTRLLPRELEIFNLTRQMSRKEVAKKLNITRQAISLTLISAINKIRKSNGIIPQDATASN